jgi:hypothetical protein
MPCHCRRFTCQKKRGGGPSEMDRHAARSQCSQSPIISSGSQLLKWQRAYKMACVPGLSSNETAGGISDACIQRCLHPALPTCTWLGRRAMPKSGQRVDPSGISWCIGFETVRTVVAAPSSISLSKQQKGRCG